MCLGSAPVDEDCAQVGSKNYAEMARGECEEYIRLIRASLGFEPARARLAVKTFPHDFGTYYEVVCWYDPHDREETEYAERCWEEAPTRWR
ncbi:MAG TPA: hypothetical protein VLH15_04255 [Dehalococcoidales bacterium]|nr:hypothetical protein [Dehalococcoidales bacterium]